MSWTFFFQLLLIPALLSGCYNKTSENTDKEIDTGTSDGDTDTDTDVDTDTDTDTDMDIDGDGDTDTDTDGDTDTDNDADTDMDTDVDTDADGDTDNDADADADTDSDTDPYDDNEAPDSGLNDVGDTDTQDPSACWERGKAYPVGAVVEVPCERCDNRCFCESLSPDKPGWSCTDCLCAQECEYNGAVYQPGETFPEGGSCNSCECVLIDLGLGYQEARTQCTLLICK